MLPTKATLQAGCLAALLGCFLLSSICPAGSFYVAPDGNDRTGDGSRQQPWSTVRHAVETVPDDGSEIVLLKGDYRQGAYLTRKFAQPVRVRAEQAYQVKWSSPPKGHRVVYLENARNLIFSGIDFSGQPSAGNDYLIQVSGSGTERVLFEDCLIHDSYKNDVVKINAGAHNVVVRNCVLFNPNDHGGDELFDVNTVTDVTVEDCILFNDYEGSGRKGENKSHSFVVIKNSGSKETTQRITFRRNIFLNWQGRTDQCYLLLGEDGKPFFEARKVLIENNLFLHHSPVRFWGTLLLKGGLKDVAFRANSVVGHPNIKWSGAYAAMCQRIGPNPPMENLILANNIWSDPSGQMPRFAVAKAKVFAPNSLPVLHNNLYWNAGRPFITKPEDTIVPDRDPKRIVADPQLGDPGAGIVLPRLDASGTAFRSGEKTIRDEFERLAKLYAVPGRTSPAIDAADPAAMPSDDILRRPRDPKPDVGCFERQAN